jgi:hypothetical protein
VAQDAVSAAEGAAVPPQAAEYARSHQAKAPKPTDRPAPDLRTAQARLEEARAALAKGQVDHAEAIAREVQSWGST